MSDTDIDEAKLTEEQLKEIEGRLAVEYEHDIAPHNRMLADVRALCRSLRQAWTDAGLAETTFKFILPNRPMATISELAKPVLDKVVALRDQLAQAQTDRDSNRQWLEIAAINISSLRFENTRLREQLAQLEKEAKLEGLREAERLSYMTGAIHERIKLLEAEL